MVPKPFAPATSPVEHSGKHVNVQIRIVVDPDVAFGIAQPVQPAHILRSKCS